jgi:hypothetical protein
MPPNSLRHSGEQIPKNRKMGSAQSHPLEHPLNTTKSVESNTLTDLVAFAKQKATVTDLVAFAKQKAMETWEYANDPNFAPPYNRYIFGDAKTMLESFGSDSIKVFRAAALALTILTTAFPTGSIAQVPKHSDEIAWAIDILNFIDPIEYLLNQNNKRETRDPKTNLSSKEVNILAWNLYFEARGEKDPKGKIAVLLTSLNRMTSKRYPSTAEGVVFQRFQNSWTLDLGNDNFKNKRIDDKAYKSIRVLFDSIVPGKRLEDSSIENIIHNCLIYLSDGDILKYQKLKNEEISGYHKLGMIPKNISNLNSSQLTKEQLTYLSEIKSEDTFRRILLMESKIDLQRAFVFGSHVFHGDVSAEQIKNFHIPMEYISTYFFWKKLQEDIKLQKSK